MRRPVPIHLTVVFLGLVAALKLLAALGLVALGLISLNKPLPPTVHVPYSAAALVAMCFGLALLAAAAATWMIVTVVGLVRMRSWARYSVLVFAGLVTGFGSILTLSSVAMPLLTSSAAPTPGVDFHAMRIVFFVSAAVYGFFTVIGAVLLVYYNLARTRALFLLGGPVASGPPHTSTGKPRPTAVTVISWLYMISGAICLLYILLPYPTFLFGFVLRGLSAHLAYAVLGILTFAIGYGLFRLRNEARLAVFGMFILCPIQMAVVMTPWGMRQFRAYMDAFSLSMAGGQYATPNPFGSPGIVMFFSTLGIAGYGVILWLLHRHRAAFTQAPPAPPLPPMPIQHEPLPTI